MKLKNIDRERDVTTMPASFIAFKVSKNQHLKNV
jgi:hypothetical protein